MSEKRINMHEDHLYGRRSRFYATRLCHTPIQSRARIHTHTHVRTRRTLQPIPSSSHPLLSLFYGHVINILSTRGGQNFDSFFFSFFFLLSLSLPPSVHLPFHHPPTKHPPVSPVPKSCMKMIFFFFHSPSLRLETFRTAFLTDDCLHLSRYRSQLDRGETRE